MKTKTARMSMGNNFFSMRSRFLKLAFSPAFFYFLFFVILTFPAILSFSDSLWADTGDGLQNVWNIWWVNKAITQLHQTVWKTGYLHYPYGTSLIGHTLNPLNGIIAIPLLKFFSLTTTYNIILTFAFVFAGVTTFWLAFYLCRSYWPSLIAGYIYTFSNFHFAHAQGHLQTVSMQWIPLFLLSWLLFLRKPNILLALFSAVVLYFNLLSDYYFFFYSVLTAGILYLWQAWQKKDVFLGYGRKIFFPALIFLAIISIFCGQIILSLILQEIIDPLLGSHPAGMFSTDLLAIFIPGGHWRFAQLTYGFWSKLSGNIHESSVSIGISVSVMLIYVLAKRKKIKDKNLSVWFVVFFFFLILSFGPNLQIAGTKINNVLMPYGFLEKTLPFISLSGMPVRMMVVVVLSSAIIFAFGLKRLFAGRTKDKVIALIFITVLFIEYLPKQILQTKIVLPAFVNELKNLPAGGVVDTVSSPSEALYYQTVHGKPLAFGYLARIPQSVVTDDMAIDLLLSGKKLTELCQTYGFKYLVADNTFGKADSAKIIYDDNKVKLLELGSDTLCQPK